MAHNWDKFVLLTWKNWLLQWRHPFQTVLEILAPVIFSALLVLIRSLVDPEDMQSITYDKFKLDNQASIFNESDTRPRRIMWSPCDNPILEGIMGNIGTKLNLLHECRDDARLLQMSLEVNGTSALAGVQFDDSYRLQDDIDKQITVTLRFPGELRTFITGANFIDMWFTNLLFPIYQMAGPRNHENNFGAIPSTATTTVKNFFIYDISFRLFF